ncbi:Gp138 family membrane-puncturing spike protein [Commensalibacter sp. Nvir]|uniref:Gp138 family membrane-puncturing spike protein n=1 Tax=Commensalibacter sp. Nvir TaxID=3069817 RepID=UPI0030C7DE9F
MLPCKVKQVNREKGLVSVTPQIQYVDPTGKGYSRGTYHNLPILSLGGGGFSLNFPIAVGDLGWILACDRDVHAFLKDKTEGPPPTYRKHSFASALFVPDMFNQVKLQADSTNGVVLQKTDGSTRIVVKDGNITLVTSGDTHIKADKGVTIDANVQINGTLHVTKDAQIDGSVSASKDVKAGSISLTSHVHGGVQSGSGTTGQPR